MSALLSTTLSLLILLLTLSHSLLIVQSSLNPDFESLLAFKKASDPSKKLTTWKNNTNPCSWTGVSCDKDRVTRLVLENLNLQGSIESLTSLTQLRVLSLKGNRFSGQVPNLPNLTSLKLLFLSHNHFSGEFPVTLTSLFRLYRLDLSYNNFSGEIPVTVNHLPHLLTLHLDKNQFSGLIPELNLLSLQDFNVSGNHLSGEIPKTLSTFSESPFRENSFLCGAPLEKCKAEPNKPGSEGAIATSPLVPSSETPTPTTTVSSSPSTMPTHHQLTFRELLYANQPSPIQLRATFTTSIQPSVNFSAGASTCLSSATTNSNSSSSTTQFHLHFLSSKHPYPTA